MSHSLRDLIAGIQLSGIWFRLATREIQLSVRRTVLGPIWLIIHRIFFAIAFSFLGALLWGREPGLNVDVLIGYLIYSTMVGYLQSGNSALISTVNLVDTGLPVSVRFLKPWAKEFQLSMLSAGVLLITSLTVGNVSSITLFMVVGLTALMALWGLGLMLLISPLAFRFRDVSQIIGFTSIILMFFSPIFWKIEDIKNKELADYLLTYNPIADFIFVFRDLINLETINLEFLFNGIVHTGLMLILGYLSFATTRRKIPYWS